jgi:phosphatidylserine/phosphatidylglycerophosphate/cardiolipin synthase-like enzyme
MPGKKSGLLLIVVASAVLACAHAALLPAPALELVETAPVETSLRHAELREAWQVWPEMIAQAQARIDLGEFYATDRAPSRLTPVIAALEAAVARGVRVRFIADAGFAKHETGVLEELSARGIQVRRLDVKASMGGVQHAKYFIVDGREAYLGSQNFDWRSLEHIQELGIRFRLPDAVRALEDIFETDWALAEGKPPPRPSTAYEFPQHTKNGVEVTLVASPRGFLPDEKLWDLPALVELIDSAKHSVRVQLLTYSEVPELQQALARAAARGVAVQLLTSDWELREKTLRELRALDPRIAVSILTIPQARAGFVPYSRVAHAKYCVVDGARAWVGTSNWEPDYFFRSRNVGLVIDGGQIPAQLDAFFTGNWTSQLAAPFDRAREYTAPRISLGGTR